MSAIRLRASSAIDEMTVFASSTCELAWLFKSAASDVAVSRKSLPFACKLSLTVDRCDLTPSAASDAGSFRVSL